MLAETYAVKSCTKLLKQVQQLKTFRPLRWTSLDKHEQNQCLDSKQKLLSQPSCDRSFPNVIGQRMGRAAKISYLDTRRMLGPATQAETGKDRECGKYNEKLCDKPTRQHKQKQQHSQESGASIVTTECMSCIKQESKHALKQRKFFGSPPHVCASLKIHPPHM